MSKISLVPLDAPETLVYKYFLNKVTTGGQITYQSTNVPFVFENGKNSDVYPQIRLEFIRFITTNSSRYIGDSIVVKNLETNLFEKVSIGEPFEAVWGLAVEAKTRDAVYYLLQQIRNRMGRTGCQRDPIYIEHSRMNRYDYFGTNSLYKAESEELHFVGRLGFRAYMRIAGGIPDPNYEPRPEVEEINMD